MALLPLTSHADIEGRVVAIQDGDTLTILDFFHVQHKVRLSGIDSPEKHQAFGNRAKESLSDCTFNKQVQIVGFKRDRYKRLLGTVKADGVDCNLRQIQMGMAWHYKKYQKEQPEAERLTYAEQESIASKRKIGLWSDPNPVPPWEYRRPATPKSTNESSVF